MINELTHGSYVKLSKFMTYLLRHNRGDYQLAMDGNGFVEIADLLEVLRTRWPYLDEEHIREIVERSEKQRFMIVGERIRANYGHSVEVNVELPVVQPPDVLFHGTTRKAARSIMEEGLKPMGRQCVHLSSTYAEAVSVGRRRQRNPVMLEIDAARAWKDGIEFRRSGTIYLVRELSMDYVNRG